MAAERILIVDDEVLERHTLSRILELEGYEVVAVASGKEALAALQRFPFDLMIVDLNMPEMSGMEVLNKALDEFPRLLVIVLTAHGSLESVIEALRKRVQDYLLKPARAEEIVSSVRRALSRDEEAVLRLGENTSDYVVRGSSPQSKAFRLPNGVTIDANKQIIAWNGHTLILTPTEGRILNVLLQNYDQVVPYAEIVYLIHGFRTGSDEAATILRPIISRLRLKLTPVPGGKELIKTVRGAGYLIVQEK